ncbi:hypothetical protein PIIN_07346 [Serendipita indica DSM 11827]|uniref:Velvet domain-containing protein n=1 Tax=Serendipita indica (strain DSM 11827) TaxID=1109443 RepID=G4TPZ9_SERID|nr:hypothetical protein PIIN_07346 [Serendipita indica DSM 11827]
MAETAYQAQYAPQQPQVAIPTPVREYEIIVRQEPKQARMCGIGGKADRRPIDPPPIVQLRVYDRYPVDPNDPNSGSAPQPHQSLNFLQNPYYFMFASLARVESDDELHLLNDGKTRYTTGSVVSSLYHLKDTENGGEDAGFFVFPDLSVRTEGSYRLKLALFEVVGSHVQFCKSVYSRAFYVYTAKKFPGMEESTPLSMSLSDQGIKIRIRKDVRNRKRTIGDVSREDEEENDEDDDEGGDDGFADETHNMMAHVSETGKEISASGRAARGMSKRKSAASSKAAAGGEGPSTAGPARGRGKNKASNPSGGGPAKRQRTQGGTIINLNQNSAQFPAAIAASVSGAPLTPTSSTHVATPTRTGAPADFSHLPPPTFPGGEPIDVLEHPATKLDPRLKHALPANTSTPAAGSVSSGGEAGASPIVGNVTAVSAGPSGASPSTVHQQPPLPQRSPTVTRHARSSSTSQLHQSTSYHAASTSQASTSHQHTASGSGPMYSTPAWQPPNSSQGMAPYRTSGGPMALPPLQIPPAQSQRSMTMTPVLAHQPPPGVYAPQSAAQYGASGPASTSGSLASPQLGSASSMHHPPSAIPLHAHSIGSSSAGGPPNTSGHHQLMMAPMHGHPYSLPPDNAQLPQQQSSYAMHPTMMMHPQPPSAYASSSHIHGHGHTHSMGRTQSYPHHAHHLSDPHAHPAQRSHSQYESYPPTASATTNNGAEYAETSPGIMSLTPVSPTRPHPSSGSIAGSMPVGHGTPISTHPHALPALDPYGQYQHGHAQPQGYPEHYAERGHSETWGRPLDED